MDNRLKCRCALDDKKIKNNTISALIDASFCSVLMKLAFQKLLTKRLEEMRHAIKTAA